MASSRGEVKAEGDSRGKATQLWRGEDKGKGEWERIKRREMRDEDAKDKTDRLCRM